MTSDQIQRAARQRVETELLFGQPFLPPPGCAPSGQKPDTSENLSALRPETLEALEQLQTLEELESLFNSVFPLGAGLADAKQPVFGEGIPDADLMFVGEAPGADEDRLGRPFVGAAGGKLDDIIKAMGFLRTQVYIANVLKARPPDNRNPLPDEIADHGPFLKAQIRIIRPKVIVALGRPSAHFLLSSNASMSRLRGIWGCWVDAEIRIPVMPTYHPAYVLRRYTKEVREQVWSDMKQVMAKLQES